MDRKESQKSISTDLPDRDPVRKSSRGDGGARSPNPSMNYLDFGQRMEGSTATQKETVIAPSSLEPLVNHSSHQPDHNQSSPDTIAIGPGEPIRQDLRLQPETKDLVHQILDVILADPKVAAALVCDIMGKLDEEAQLGVWQTCFRAMSGNLRKRIMDQIFL
ncbi:hypothetical protein G7Y79_00060g092690 [Physcia stellaris]|nr:hypothetical protein G7Y79_00060g092690 [Physcia stellaris]